MAGKLIAACSVLLLLLIGYINLDAPRVVNAADEQAVIVSIKLRSGDMGNSDEPKHILAFEDQLDAAIKNSKAGDFDGDEFGGGICTIYMYGPSADRLFAAVQPVLKKFHAPAGSYLIKRYGKPGAKQERLAIGIGDTSQSK